MEEIYDQAAGARRTLKAADLLMQKRHRCLDT
jgi:hypothetical protein